MQPPEDSHTRPSTYRDQIPPLGQTAKIFLFGLFMGTADAIPGVSGGTIALLIGIYERLITAITTITPQRLLALCRAVTPIDGPPSLNHATDILNELDAGFLTVLGSGIIVAVVTIGQLVEYVEHHAPIVLYGFFFGLIAASALILLREITIETPMQWAVALLGFLIAFLLSGRIQFLERGGLVVIFIAGAIAVSAMILPGLSGSLLLVILGQYTRMYAALGAFLDGLAGVVLGDPIARVVDPGKLVVVFLLGGVIGLFTFARLIRRLLSMNRPATMAFLVALVVGALRAPVAELSSRKSVTWTLSTLGEFAGVAIVGVGIVVCIDWYAGDLDLDAI